MVYDKELAGRIRQILASLKGLDEKKMFGGISFLLNGNMCCGVVKDNLVIRIGRKNYEKALAEPHARPMDFTGRPLSGFIYVSPSGYLTDKDLTKWLKQAIAFTKSLPPK